MWQIIAVKYFTESESVGLDLKQKELLYTTGMANF